MPDWKQIVRKDLRVLGVLSPEFAEELAGHLEDSYEASQHEGVTADVAFQRTHESDRRSPQDLARACDFLQEGCYDRFQPQGGLCPDC
jgi:hypothetical protein